MTVRVPAGTTLPSDPLPFAAFDVSEDHPNWSTLRTLFQQWGVSDFMRTEFSKREIEAAHWLEIGAWHHGYPQPGEDVFGYRHATYDLSDWCEQCGVGMRQKAPFQMKGEPRWGKKSILQLTWVDDELFIAPQVWASVFKPAGIDCRSVMNTKGAALKTVVQLVVEATAGIITDGLASERCGRCGRTKYLPVTRGAFPALRDAPAASMVRTAEYFGSGAQAGRRVLIPQGLARSLASNAVRGVTLKPVSDPPPREQEIRRGGRQP